MGIKENNNSLNDWYDALMNSMNDSKEVQLQYLDELRLFIRPDDIYPNFSNGRSIWSSFWHIGLCNEVYIQLIGLRLKLGTSLSELETTDVEYIVDNFSKKDIRLLLDHLISLDIDYDIIYELFYKSNNLRLKVSLFWTMMNMELSNDQWLALDACRSAKE